MHNFARRKLAKIAKKVLFCEEEEEKIYDKNVWYFSDFLQKLASKERFCCIALSACFIDPMKITIPKILRFFQPKTDSFVFRKDMWNNLEAFPSHEVGSECNQDGAAKGSSL